MLQCFSHGAFMNWLFLVFYLHHGP